VSESTLAVIGNMPWSSSGSDALDDEAELFRVDPTGELAASWKLSCKEHELLLEERDDDNRRETIPGRKERARWKKRGRNKRGMKTGSLDSAETLAAR
jgi:hypothetical protein